MLDELFDINRKVDCSEDCWIWNVPSNDENVIYSCDEDEEEYDVRKTFWF